MLLSQLQCSLLWLQPVVVAACCEVTHGAACCGVACYGSVPVCCGHPGVAQPAVVLLDVV